METVHIFRLEHLPSSLCQRLREAQQEAAQVWNLCCQTHQEARQQRTPWPQRDELQKLTRGKFALHSQTVQMICQAFLANVETARQVKKHNPRMRYPYKEKRFYPLLWPAQAVPVEAGRVVLPMGRGRKSVVLKVKVPAEAGACKIVWNDGYELHVCCPVPAVDVVPGTVQATVDLGEIHQAAVTTNTGKAVVVSGRGIRSLKRQRHQQLGQIAKLRSKCTKGSRRWKKLQRARAKVSARAERRIRDLRHKGTRQVVDFCVREKVGTLFVGDPDGVRRHKTGRQHQQRMSGWEYGKDIAYLTHKCHHQRIVCFIGSERGTSSRCPECGWKQRPKGRKWVCRGCSFTGQRDLVGSLNMHPLAFGNRVRFPHHITYLRPGNTPRVLQLAENKDSAGESSIRTDTCHREGEPARTDVVLVDLAAHPPVCRQAPSRERRVVRSQPRSSSRSRD